jgi:hypothetical protein
MVLRWLTQRRLARGAQTSDSEKCWLCGAAAPALVAPEVYRCCACGRVQGDAAGAWLTAERHRRIAELPADARLARAQAALGEAQLVLIASEGELSAVRELIGVLGSDRNDERREEAAARLASALLRVAQTHALLNDAAVSLGAPVEPELPGPLARAWPANAILADATKGLRQVATLAEQHSRLSAVLARANG